MVSMIAANSQVFIADARELERDTPSYTYTTLCELRQEIGDQYKIFWLLGADALNDFPAWHKASEIMQLCHVLVLRRPGYNLTQDQESLNWLNKYMCDDIKQLEESDFGHIYQTETDMLDISSTKIRAMVKSGEQPRYMMPGGIWNYIKRNKLYSGA